MTRNTEKACKAAETLLKELRKIPEPSGKEYKTSELLKNFLLKETDCIIEDVPEQPGNHPSFIARLGEKTDSPARRGKDIVFRADLDAVSVSGADAGGGLGKGYAHACGHDGHSSLLAGLAFLASETPPGLNRSPGKVTFLFQSAEETGVGAKTILEKGYFSLSGADRIFGLHNIPGYPLGSVLLSEPVFACASLGLSLGFKGSPAHAAYPEAGKNPALILADTIKYLYGNSSATIVHALLGKPAFGTAAAEAVVSFTLRNRNSKVLLRQKEEIVSKTAERSEREGLLFTFAESDYFPATVCDKGCLVLVRRAAEKAGLASYNLPGPMRWSEDFGYYTEVIRGAFFGIGAGKEHPQLHTREYKFPETLIEPGLRMLYSLYDVNFPLV